MSDLIHCIYASSATTAFRTADLVELLAAARDRNAVLNITGVLLYHRGHFLQVLEGEQAVVEQLFAHIERDPRHDHVVEIIHEPIARRSFRQWSMGFAHLQAEDLAGVEGLNDFFSTQHLLRDIDHGRARKLIQAFAAGRWQRRLQTQVEQLGTPATSPAVSHRVPAMVAAHR